jgi:hypothetical protein
MNILGTKKLCETVLNKLSPHASRADSAGRSE